MVVNFIGNFQNGYVGEISDESHICRELERLGHKVIRVPRDVWKASVDGYTPNPDWILPEKDVDVSIVCKWPHFDTEKYIVNLKMYTNGAPVLYWVWDWMNEFNPDNWNFKMAKASDLYLTGEGGLIGKYRQVGIPAYYFQMDVCDGDIEVFCDQMKTIDLVFTGSYIQKGHRREWLQEINKEIPVSIYSWNHKEWIKLGFKAYPAVYGKDYNLLISQSKIVLGFNVEPNCYGYWSNRIGKVMRAGGFLLQEFTPGMEKLMNYPIDFFSSSKEAISKIKSCLESGCFNNRKVQHYPEFTSAYKVVELCELIERYNKRTEDWIL